MTRRLAVCVALLAAAGSALADEEPGGGVKAMSGMSVLGNQEAPKALVIVPWKSSEQGDRQGVTSALDERARPVDRDVFLRELSYYEIRTGRDGSVSSR
jgi:hypothetical protein